MIQDVEDDLRIRWYQLQLDSVRPGLDTAEAARIIAEKAKIAADMQKLGIEVPPSIDVEKYALPE